MKSKILLGDSLEVLKQVEDHTFDAVVTDPPYGMGQKDLTVEEIVNYLRGEHLDTGGDILGHDWSIPSVALWKEVSRVLKPGAHLAVWASTRTWDLMALGLRAAGFEFRDTIGLAAHVHGMGFPKSINLEKKANLEGAGTSLKPSWEPILLFRKPLEGSLTENALKYGTGGIQIEANRVRHQSLEDFESHKIGVEAHRRRGGSLQGSWKNTSPLSGANDVSYAGRWPPNVLLQHDERCKKVGEQQVPAPVINRYTDGMKPFGGGAGHAYETVSQGRTETVPVYECVSGCPVLAINEQHEGSSKYFPSFHPLDVPFRYHAKASLSEATIGGKISNKHPTKKPLGLAAWVVRLVTPKGGVLLDPFAGSGSIPCAAVMEGFDAVGIDAWKEMVEETARPRLEYYLKQREETQAERDLFNAAFLPK